jgi:murein DD-endopeptidase MepM/ murein hydrolase activator NlpD
MPGCGMDSSSHSRRGLRAALNALILLAAAVLFASLPKNSAAPPKENRPQRHDLLLAGSAPRGPELIRGGLAIPGAALLSGLPVVTATDFPLGSETGALTYNARPFREVNHLGDDLNGIGGQNSDLGDPVFAAADGLVLFAGDAAGGWGNVVILQHRSEQGDFFQTFYGHLDSINVRQGSIVPRGQPLGTTGTAHGQYYAHLHLEVRRGMRVDLGSGYSPLPLNRENPEDFLRQLGRKPPARLHSAPGLTVRRDEERK